MSGIEVSGGGSFAVTTESLLEAQRMLRELARRTEQLSGDLGAGPVPPGEVDWLLATARRELALADEQARALADGLGEAAVRYGIAERLSTAQAWLAAHAGGGAFDLAVLAAQAAALAPAGRKPWTDEQFDAWLRRFAESVDVPLALWFVRELPGRALEETDVTVESVGDPVSDSAPAGFADLAARIPAADEGAPQVRVERYDQPDGSRRFVVYAGGTVEWNAVADDEPWDLTSNASGVAGEAAASTRATMAALQQAGWQLGDEVLPVGHSQGGIVAAGLVSSAAVSAPMLVTFGSPTAGVSVPSSTTNVAVEHVDDPVPTLGGLPRVGAGALDRVVVRESTDASASAGGGGVPQHRMSGYRATAEQMDASSDRRLVAARERLAAFTGGGTATVTLWRGERVYVAPGAGAGTAKVQ
ncbi:alpha/beta hydrolase family protein [Gryllotalpicola ginsengisoli]|uniref:hypothetical protein n=1 Tax=Gryllotalpicola ginsengisoli TaxID=444608 RepID=UPI0003B316B5|nr:hypothetical protein [Gryllotalpicola ginsengisoli]